MSSRRNGLSKEITEARKGSWSLEERKVKVKCLGEDKGEGKSASLFLEGEC